MTTLHGSKSNLTVSLGFFVLVLGAIAASTLVRGSTTVGVVFAGLAVVLVIVTVVLHLQPANELRISSDTIELARPGRTIGSINRADVDGRIEVRRQIYRGRTFWHITTSASSPGTGIPVDDFTPQEIADAAHQQGWIVSVVE